MPTAAITSVIDSGRMRSPVSIAESPSAIERNSGTAKNRPAWSRYWKKNAVSPLRSSRTRRIAGIEQRGPAGVAPVLLPARGRRAAPRPPPRISQITGERPNHVGASGLGCTKPQVPGAQDAVDDQAEPERRERGADEVEAGALLLRACRRCAG